MKHLETIIESGIMDGISKSDYIQAFEELCPTGRPVKKGSVVCYEGDLIDKIFILEKGCVRGEKTYLDGDVHIVQIYEEGSMFGLEATVSKKKTSPTNYVCNEDSVIVQVPFKNVYKSQYCKQILEVLLHHLADDNIKKMHKTEMLAQRGLRERLMIYFGVLRGKSGGDIFELRMDREQLAQFLCVNRSALSNELNKMKREGIIDFDKDKFKVL